MRSVQAASTDIEYGNRRRVLRREAFLEAMDSVIPWERWIAVIEPHYYPEVSGRKGRKPKWLATMLRMYLPRAWFSLSDEGVQEAIYDSYAMQAFGRGLHRRAGP